MEESTVMAGLLHEIGLSATEAEVYLELLKGDDILASDLADEVSNSRTHVYDTLDNLVDKSLVTFTIKSGKRYYRASHPRRLVDYLNEKREKIDEQREQMMSLVPEFLKLHKGGRRRMELEVFEGEEGLHTVLKDILRTGLDFLVLNASEQVYKDYGDVFGKFYRSRKRAKIGARLLYPKGSNPVEFPLDKSGIVPRESCGALPIYVYGDNIAIVFAAEELLTVKITNMEIARRHAEQFNRLWKTANK
jgi:sugar-specific transcriptional regulator TrmB